MCAEITVIFSPDQTNVPFMSESPVCKRIKLPLEILQKALDGLKAAA